jgi:hypothetical protein
MSMETKKPQMGDAERIQLAEKLDADIDKFMEELAARKKTEGDRKPFNFDEWCKELDEHPVFMKDLKYNDKGDLPESLQALQALKYDEDETEDRNSQAERHKTEGNKHFKFKKYRWAIDAYTQGMKVNCMDAKLNAVLYANRAAANRHLGNIRSAIRDSVFARKFDPTHFKAILRCAECLLELNQGMRCLQWIDLNENYLSSLNIAELREDIFHCLAKLEELRSSAKKSVEEELRNKRKETLARKKDREAKEKLLKALKERQLRFTNDVVLDDVELFEWTQLDVALPQLKEASISLTHYETFPLEREGVFK